MSLYGIPELGKPKPYNELRENITLRCQRCGYEWLPRIINGIPKKCPQCGIRIKGKKGDGEQ